MHQIIVGHITIREHNLIHIMLFDEFRQLLLGIDRNPFGIPRSRQLRWIPPLLNPRNLSGGECHNIIRSVIAEEDIEIMEVSARSAHDQHFSFSHDRTFL